MLGVAGFLPLLVFGCGVARWRTPGPAARCWRRRTEVGVHVGLLVQALLDWGRAAAARADGVQSGAFAMSSPARGAIIPRLLPEEPVPAANTLNHTSISFSMVLGPLSAGLVLVRDVRRRVRHRRRAVHRRAVRGVPAADAGAGGEVTAPGLRSVIEGQRFILTRPVLLLSFAVDIVAMVFAMPRALFPEVAEERFGGGRPSAGCSPRSRSAR